MSRTNDAKRRVLRIDHQDLDFTFRGGPPGAAYVARAISNEVSPNIGVGFARWEGAQVAWTVLYDEVIFVIEGCFELRVGDELLRSRPGSCCGYPKAPN